MLYSPDVFQTSPLWDEEAGLCQCLTRDEINRIPTRVFKSCKGKDTIKSKNAANLDTTNTEEPSGSTNVDDDDCKGATGVDHMEECHICCSEFVDNETLRILPCSHEFHIQCTDQWIRVSVVSVQKRERGVKNEGRKGGAGKVKHLKCVSNYIDTCITGRL